MLIYMYITQNFVLPYIAAMITHMDSAIGEVIDTLMDTGMWKNTFFAFSSDVCEHISR